MVPLLSSMLSDRDLGNHRLALTTLNSAIHNKMDLLLAHLDELLPAVFGDTHLKPEFIREVQMGPFKHKVDDGLDLRKVSVLQYNALTFFLRLDYRAPTKPSTPPLTPPSPASTLPSYSTVSLPASKMSRISGP